MLSTDRVHFLANQTSEQMMSFIIQTHDGYITVIDGGTAGDADHLVRTLQAITGQQRPRVDAWFLTHPHLDHVGAIVELLSRGPLPLDVRHVYCNLPSRQFLQRHDKVIGSIHIDRMLGQLPRLADVIDVVSVGDSYQVGAARFDVLYTFDAAVAAEPYNDASVVLRMTMGGRTLLFLGDLYEDGGEKLLAMYGSRLASDAVQMAHHGQNGVRQDVYAAIAPKTCFWCTPQWLWDNDAGAGYNTHTWRTMEVRGWMQALGVQRHYVIKDGDWHLDWPLQD